MQIPPQSTAAFVLSMIIVVISAFFCGGAVSLFAFDRLAAPPKESRLYQTTDQTPIQQPAATEAVPAPPSPSAIPAETPTAIPTKTVAPVPTSPPTRATPSANTPSSVPAQSPTPRPAPSSARGPDLVVLPTSHVVGSLLKRGQTATVIIEGANQGDADVSNALVKADIQLQVFGAYITLYTYSETFPSIKAGQTVRREISGGIPEQLASGTYRLRIIIDPNGSIEESSESNNLLDIIVPVE